MVATNGVAIAATVVAFKAVENKMDAKYFANQISYSRPFLPVFLFVSRNI
jgi:hypothetical protein